MAELEVYYAIADFTNYIVASEELEPGYGWEYTSLIKETYEHASNSMAVAGGWVNSFKQFYSVNFPNEQATLSALNMHYWNDFDGLFQSWIEMSSWLEDGFRSDAKDSTITTQFGKQVSEPLGFTTVDLDMIVNKCGGSDDSFRREIDKLFKKGLVINKWSSNQTQYDNISGLSIGVPDDTNPLCTQAQYYPNVYNGSNWNWSEQHLKNYFIKLGLLI